MPRRLLVTIASLALVAPHALAEDPYTEDAHSEDAPAPQESAPQAASRPNYDVLVLNGQTLEGVVLSESDDHVTIRVTVAGINAEMDYPRSAVQEIRPGAGAPIPPAPPPHYFTIAPPDAPITGGVYWITLTGTLGQEISETPIRDAFRDAMQFNPDVIIIEVNNTPRPQIPPDKITPELEKLLNNSDELYRAEKFLTIPTEEVPDEWTKSPRIVYWVKNALGGVCFLPLTSKEVYFAPDGKLGGMPMNSALDRPGAGFGRALHRQHAVGWINHSDFPQPETLTRGLVTRSYVLSVRIEDGKHVLFEGLPTNPNEILLTDDGQGPNADTPEQIAAGTGNDLLTLDADTAQLLGISKGTAATREELLALLDLGYARVIDDRADLIMQKWAQGVENAHAQLARLVTEYEAIKIEGDHAQRRAARAAAINCAEQIKSIANRWNEGLDPIRVHEADLPADSDGINIPRTQQAIDKLRLLQSLDRRE